MLLARRLGFAPLSLRRLTASSSSTIAHRASLATSRSTPASSSPVEISTTSSNAAASSITSVSTATPAAVVSSSTPRQAEYVLQALAASSAGRSILDATSNGRLPTLVSYPFQHRLNFSKRVEIASTLPTTAPSTITTDANSQLLEAVKESRRQHPTNVSLKQMLDMALKITPSTLIYSANFLRREVFSINRILSRSRSRSLSLSLSNDASHSIPTIRVQIARNP
jgi:hypothetical protein